MDRVIKVRVKKNVQKVIEEEAFNYIYFNYLKHKELWKWVAENPFSKKQEWPGWRLYEAAGLHITQQCFACHYAAQVLVYLQERGILEENACRYCPLEWPEKHREEAGCGPLYSQWMSVASCHEFETKIKLSKTIGRLKVKPWVKTYGE